MTYDETTRELMKEFQAKFVEEGLAGDGEPLKIASHRLIADYIDGMLLTAEMIEVWLSAAFSRIREETLKEAIAAVPDESYATSSTAQFINGRNSFRLTVLQALTTLTPPNSQENGL